VDICLTGNPTVSKRGKMLEINHVIMKFRNSLLYTSCNKRNLIKSKHWTVCLEVYVKNISAMVLSNTK